MHPKTKKLIKRIALEEGLHPDIVKEIVMSQFRFVKEVMAEGDKNDPDTLQNMQLTHFGKFYVKPGRRKYFKQVADDERDKDTE